jgi:hypothetical protein
VGDHLAVRGQETTGVSTALPVMPSSRGLNAVQPPDTALAVRVVPCDHRSAVDAKAQGVG